MNKFLSSIVICSIVSSAAMAGPEKASYGNNPSKQETTGFVGGVALGAIAGGPPGAILGGALGALFGDGWKARNEVSSLQVDLVETRAAYAKLSSETEEINRKYRLAIAELDSVRNRAPQYLNVVQNSNSLVDCCDNTGLSLHFRSGSSQIEPQYTEQLSGLAKIAGLLPNTRIEIVGYADRNGDTKKNLSLSKKRSDEVKRFLNRTGIQNLSITTVAYGDTKPLDATQSFESDFFDRRVIVRLVDTSKQLLTQNPEN
ncbi:MAG: sortase-associated OmpA-like protein PdsO [Pseudohongiellaceae bacterium]